MGLSGWYSDRAAGWVIPDRAKILISFLEHLVRLRFPPNLFDECQRLSKEIKLVDGVMKYYVG
jgi:hypothetical protein